MPRAARAITTRRRTPSWPGRCRRLRRCRCGHLLSRRGANLGRRRERPATRGLRARHGASTGRDGGADLRVADAALGRARGVAHGMRVRTRRQVCVRRHVLGRGGCFRRSSADLVASRRGARVARGAASRGWRTRGLGLADISLRRPAIRVADQIVTSVIMPVIVAAWCRHHGNRLRLFPGLSGARLPPARS